MYRAVRISPPTLVGTIKSLGLAVPPPPAVNPQVYAQNYSCPTPNIPVFMSYPYSKIY